MCDTHPLPWSVEGTYFEACNCLPICPCRQVGGRDGGRSTFGMCDFALSWWIRRGHSGDLDLTDRQVVMVGSYDDDEPGSPWTVALFTDDAADVEQQSVLADICLGRVGGTPRRNYGGAIHTVIGIGAADISLNHQRRHWRIRVDGRIDVVADTEIDSEETVACGIPGLDSLDKRCELRRCERTSSSWCGSGRTGAGRDEVRVPSRPFVT